jgi:hypothetical protein
VVNKTKPPIFFYNQQEYPVETFSVWSAKDGKICLRYEAENIGGRPIYEFYWDLIDGWQTFTLYPRTDTDAEHLHRVKNSILVSATEAEPEPLDSNLEAFRGIKPTSTEVYQQVQKVGSANGNQPEIVDASQQFPELTQQLKDAGDFYAHVFAYRIPREPAELGSFERQLSLANGTFRSTSQAKFDGKTFSIITTLDFEANVPAKIQVFAPALLAMQKAGSADQFVELLSEFRSAAIPLGEPVVTEYPASFEPSKLQAFVTTYPVTVRMEGQSTCFKVSGYSRFPIPVGRAFCN